MANLIRLVRFAFVSLAVVAVNLGVLLGLTELGVAIEIAAVLGAAFGIILGYFGHSSVTFMRPSRSSTRFARYLVTYGAQILVSVVMLSFWTRMVGTSVVSAYVLTAVPTALATYVTLRLWVYR